jgi:hypothetical protein
MTEKNEAAERLDFHFRLECGGTGLEGEPLEAATSDIEQALAAERAVGRAEAEAEMFNHTEAIVKAANRATVERIRERLLDGGIARPTIDAILDEEAAR